MQNIALVHVSMGRNFNQFCLPLCVHLDGLVVLLSRLADLNIVIYLRMQRATSNK